MRYLIIPKSGKPFFTNWYDYEDDYEEGMVVIKFETNLMHQFSSDGKTFEDIEFDSL